MAGDRQGAKSKPLLLFVAIAYGWSVLVSLTVAAVQKSGFRIWIIPHTYEVTALRQRKIGDAVNLEGDLIGKYVEKFVSARSSR